MHSRIAYAVGLLLLLFSVGRVGGAYASDSDAEAVLQSHSIELPQWEDVGLEDLLVVSSQPQVSSPTCIRLLHDGASTLVRDAFARRRDERTHVSPESTPHRPQPHRLYLLLCLRL